MTSICREYAANAKNRRDGQMALRRCAAGMVEVGTQFRRAGGHPYLPALRTALPRRVGAEKVGAVCYNGDVS